MCNPYVDIRIIGFLVVSSADNKLKNIYFHVVVSLLRRDFLRQHVQNNLPLKKPKVVGSKKSPNLWPKNLAHK